MKIRKVAICPYCHKETIVYKHSTSHIFHLIMTLITGFWLIIWLLCALSNRYWRCETCRRVVG